MAERAERAADIADKRARDADRVSRWVINVAFGVATLILSAQLVLAYRVSTVEASLQRIETLLTGSPTAASESEPEPRVAGQSLWELPSVMW